MPIYEYECTKCKKHHEIMRKITEKPLTICPSCGGKMKKLISNTSFVLKGSGWYATDYASSKGKGGAKDPDKKEKKPIDLKSELKKELKEDTKSEKKSEKKDTSPAK